MLIVELVRKHWSHIKLELIEMSCIVVDMRAVSVEVSDGN